MNATAARKAAQAGRASATAEAFLRTIEALGLPPPCREWRVVPDRRFRFDYAWPEYEVAVEQEGGIWIYGAHNRGMVYSSNMEKYNIAQTTGKLGWIVLRFEPRDMKNGAAAAWARGAIERRGWVPIACRAKIV